MSASETLADAVVAAETLSENTLQGGAGCVWRVANKMGSDVWCCWCHLGLPSHHSSCCLCCCCTCCCTASVAVAAAATAAAAAAAAVLHHINSHLHIEGGIQGDYRGINRHVNRQHLQSNGCNRNHCHCGSKTERVAVLDPKAAIAWQETPYVGLTAGSTSGT